MQKYLDDVARLFRTNGFRNPCHDISGKIASQIRDVLNEQKRWESRKNRREPLTWPMIDLLHNLTTVGQDNLFSALLDWLILGMYTGARLSEWAQSESHMKTSRDIARCVGGLPTAFTPNDFSFLRADGSRLSQGYTDLATISVDVSFVNITWRVQKNNENGEVITFARNLADPHRCPVLAAIRILERAQRLDVTLLQPLAVFAPKVDCCFEFICDGHISQTLRMLASKVYNLQNPADLQRWSSHSIRVGACVALHEAGFDAMFIKHRLRWRSDTFISYLRNMCSLAIQHVQALRTPACQQPLVLSSP